MGHMTTPAQLEQLSQAVQTLLARQDIKDTIARLKREVPDTADTFVWATIPLPAPGVVLPAHILSGWIFVLKADTPSGAHQHPNSVQHMLMLEGRGRSRVGDQEEPLRASRWVVIPEGVGHEFFPEGDAMVVMSFHTCVAEELEEVAVGTGASRHYA
jgi:quercetin dioxygenase-like cupin family protein